MSRAMLILNTKADRERAVAWVNKAPTGTRVEYKDPRRTLAQNDRFYAMLTDVARQHRINGKKYSTEAFKIMFLTAYAEETGKEIKYLPALHRAGMIPSGRSSSDLSVKEMSELIEWILAWGAENGIAWSEPKAAEDAA
jgi:hypothetical protein